MPYILGTLVCEDDEYESIGDDNHKSWIQTSVYDIYYTYMHIFFPLNSPR